MLVAAAAQLAAYFAGERTEFDLPAGSGRDAVPAGGVGGAAARSATARRRRTARSRGRLGLTGHGARAVGVANGRNPIPVIVPCHRVVGASGALTGYGGGMDRKRILLDLEGALAPRLI